MVFRFREYRLEQHFQTELNIARFACAGDDSEILAGFEAYVWQSKARSVECVKEFSPEFKSDSLSGLELLEQCKVPVLEPRPIQDISAGIAEPRISGFLIGLQSCGGETRGVKPLIDCFCPLHYRFDRGGRGRRYSKSRWIGR